VYFNDSSKAILSPAAPGTDPAQQEWEYIERRHAAGTPQAVAQASLPERAVYTLTHFPAHLQKKVTLLRHFSSHLLKPTPVASNDEPQSASSEPQVSRRSPPKSNSVAAPSSPAAVSPSSSSVRDASGALIYVKKWLRTKHAIFFRLSNRTVQVIFQDHTELVLSSQTNCVTYTDKNRRRETCRMERTAAAPANDAADALMDRPDLAKRMKYTKEILHLLISRNSAPAAVSAPVSNAGVEATPA
jgi:polo-like kinase 1